MASGIRRLMRDFEEAQQASHKAGWYHVSLFDEDSSGYHLWEVVIKGPVGSLYEGGEYHVRLNFDDSFPYFRPKAEWATEIHHPNMKRSAFFGKNSVKLDVLMMWRVETTVMDIINGMNKAMEDPDPDRQIGNEGEHLCPDIAYQFKHDREAFDKKARQRAKIAAPYKPELTHFWWEIPKEEWDRIKKEKEKERLDKFNEATEKNEKNKESKEKEHPAENKVKEVPTESKEKEISIENKEREISEENK